MGIKIYKPTTPGRRGMTGLTFKELTKKKPEKSLSLTLSRKAGRGIGGKISVRHKGGGVKRKYRLIDFKQIKMDVEGKVLSIEYDPNRSSFIALVEYKDGDKRYILAPQGIKVGSKVITSLKGDIKPGNRFILKNIPSGAVVYNIEMSKGRGGQLVRSAGTGAQIMGKDNNYIHLKMPSGEIRRVHKECMASIGTVSNPEHSTIKIGKAGRSRWMGIRPTVRGKAMYPAAHPHGGGEGSNDIGMPSPKTPWGVPTLGKKTRKRKYTDKMIIQRKKRKKRG